MLLKKTLSVISVAVAAGIIILVALSIHHDGETTRLLARLDGEKCARSQGRVDFRRFESLPRPVRAYFRAVLKDGQPYIRKARLVQSGELATGPEVIRRSHFTAEEHVSARKPGFLWNARISLAPLLHVRVLDSYVSSKGAGSVLLLSAVKVSAAENDAKLDAGALYRYLAEAVWYPTALLPENGDRKSVV